MFGAESDHWDLVSNCSATRAEKDEPKTRNKSQVEVEDILQPFDGGGGLVGKDLDQLGTSLVSGGLDGVLVEGLDAVVDAEVALGAGQGTVNTGGGLGGVATEESWGIQSAGKRATEAANAYPAYPEQVHCRHSGRRCGRH